MEQHTAFAATLRRLRTARDMTQEALAEAVGCSPQTVRAFESGRRRPSREMANRLATILHVPDAERATFVDQARLPVAPEAPAAPLPPAPRPVAGSLIGRAAELTQVRHNLLNERQRLVTLLGPGGIGKTRLALQIAHDVQANYPDGTAFVALAPVYHLNDTLSAIASAVGCALTGAQNPRTTLLHVLAQRQMLLVLDNLEHLLVGETGAQIGALVADVLHHAPGIAVLVTSRERLRLSQEWLIELKGLALPTDARPSTIARSEAVLLFITRARQHDQHFALTPANRTAIASICAHLNGVPLGIELAASWVRVLTCEEIAAELARGNDLHALADRDLPDRHRSLYRVVDHSWRLLGEDEQLLLAQLSVADGGMGRDAIGALAAPGTRPAQLLATLAALVDKSLVRRASTGAGAARYDLHEIVRQYAAARLAERPESAVAAHSRHAAFFAAWLASQDARLKSAAQRDTLRDLTQEIGNIRAAWEWSARHQNVILLRQMTPALHWLYEVRGWYAEGARMFARAAAALRHAPPPAAHAVWLMLVMEGWHTIRSDLLAGLAAMRNGIAGVRQFEHAHTQGLALTALAYAEIFIGNYTVAEALLNESAALARAHREPWILSVTLVVRGVMEALRSDDTTARQHLAAALHHARTIGDPRHVSLTQIYLGVVALRLGQLEEAEQASRECLTIAMETQDRFQISLALQTLGQVALARSDTEASRWLFDEALTVAREIGDRWLEAQTLGAMAALQQHLGDAAAARGHHVAAVEAADGAPIPIALEELAALAHHAAANAPDAAAIALAFVSTHPLAHPRTRQHARQRLGTLPPPNAARLHTFPLEQPARLLGLFRDAPTL